MSTVLHCHCEKAGLQVRGRGAEPLARAVLDPFARRRPLRDHVDDQIVSASSMTIASLPRGWDGILPYLSHKEKAKRTCASWLTWLAEAPERERAEHAEHEDEVRARGLRVPDPATSDLFGEAP